MNDIGLVTPFYTLRQFVKERFPLLAWLGSRRCTIGKSTS